MTCQHAGNLVHLLKGMPSTGRPINEAWAMTDTEMLQGAQDSTNMSFVYSEIDFLENLHYRTLIYQSVKPGAQMAKYHTYEDDKLPVLPSVCSLAGVFILWREESYVGVATTMMNAAVLQRHPHLRQEGLLCS